MAEDEGKKEEENFDFTPEGEAVNYISLDRAGLLAVEYARGHVDFYGPDYADQELVWKVLSQDENEDYYDIRVSYRPQGTFRGTPGVEQFGIDKTGNIRRRRRLRAPSRLRTRLFSPFAVIISAICGFGVVAFAFEGSANSHPTPEPTRIAVPPRDGAQTGRAEQLTPFDIQKLIFNAINDYKGGVLSHLTEADIKSVVAEVLAANQRAGEKQRTQAEVESLV